MWCRIKPEADVCTVRTEVTRSKTNDVKIPILEITNDIQMQ